MTGPVAVSDLLAATPGWAERAGSAGLDATDVAQFLAEAERLAADLTPLGDRADREGCRLEAGRVRTPEGYPETYARLGADGWIAPDIAPELGGLGLPLALHAAMTLPLEAAAAPFLMAAAASRAGAHLLSQTAPDLAGTWAPRLASGDWAATICMSEPDAGSDAGRIRTRATRDGEGWRIEGTKCWISFGDQDMTARIGHLLLARTGPMEQGTRGLSLFLVPDRDEAGARAPITVGRIEEKLGLHGSPTCTLAFAGAPAALIGEEGWGVPLLFHMIERMRLQVGVQGAGIARRAATLARGYAEERRQGGDPAAPPVPIVRHPDVRRQLTALDAGASVLTALVLELGVLLEGSEEDRALAAFLLPLAKTFGGEGASAGADGAIQVLGGAGYTSEWPAERLLRDARILTIYEGTTGMQAQDLTLRRIRKDEGRTAALLDARARAEIAGCGDERAASAATEVLDRFAKLVRDSMKAEGERLLLSADGMLRAAWVAVESWLACRMIGLGEDAATQARFLLHNAPARMALAEAQASLPPDTVA
ncbi:acyl-CoA dehydrogenase family protein [Histidinibacterium aquaticum]|uniref:Acyl-CoA dehydrogenase n=1 Tax=Histidinibacterium aquaticum TaxID=2613962 RepID=A0A5J5GJD2_9RHOB|nr:acyl-CoA dehydrogenase family protein [Histidinibacterium aquaticum]KAA9007853.1 acyl-CoA dehydrogenase [Histidinibacterium aquaticum]